MREDIDIGIIDDCSDRHEPRLAGTRWFIIKGNNHIDTHSFWIGWFIVNLISVQRAQDDALTPVDH
jgi:hypothetical protein